MSTHTLPTLADLTCCLIDIRDDIRGNVEDTDVRIQYLPSEGWALHTGDASYDQDHRGHWGASCVPADATMCDLRDIARDLLEQVRDSIATDEVW